MKIEKRMQVFVRGIGFITAEEVVKLVQGGNTVELRSTFGNWVKVSEGYTNVKSDSIKLGLRNGTHVITSSDTNILHILPKSYSIASTKIDELKKSNILVFGNQLMDEENCIHLDDNELEDIAIILNTCNTYIDHGCDVFTFFTNNKEYIEKIFKRFVPKNKQNKINISYKKLGKYKESQYGFRLNYKDASEVFKIIEKYGIDIGTKNIPNCLFTANRDTRIRFYKLLKLMSYYEIILPNGKPITVGGFSKKSYNTVLNYANFMHTIGINGLMRMNNLYSGGHTIPRTVYQINADDCNYSMNVDESCKYTGARSLVYVNPSWNTYGTHNDYPASCKSVFYALCNDNGSETYKFLKKFYEYQQPIKIKSISEVKEEDMVEIIVDDYADINGVFLK